MAKKSSEMPVSEKDWRAENDARTLIEAERIKLDKGRYGKAQEHAKAESEALRKIVPQKPTGKPKAPPPRGGSRGRGR